MHKRTASVVLVDDHQLIRAGIRALIEDMKGFVVVAEAGDAETAFDAVQTHDPDIVITDISMRGDNGIALLQRLSANGCRSKLLVLSMYSTADFVLSALRAGANGYLLKDAASVELTLALAALRRGDPYLSPAISGAVLTTMLSGAGGTATEGATPPPDVAAPAQSEEASPPCAASQSLTPRQQQVLTMIAQGQTNKLIAKTLALSVKTVETYRTQIMHRLNIRDVAGLTLYAVRCGLVSP
jgi:DNA-binding NarL/FixJ family response regulator